MHNCKILIADDEKLAREAVKLQLQKIDNISIVAECRDGKETLNAIKEHKPDIIFLDIQMPYITGLDVMEKLGAAYSPYVIFVTAYDTYAIKAFECDAVDYLVKPFNEKRFQKAFHKAFNQWKASAAEPPQMNSLTEIKRIIDSLSAEEIKSTISIKDGGKIYLVHLDDVSHIEAAGNYVMVVTKEKKYLHKEVLQTLEEKLPSSFVRIHKSYIVNTPFIKEFQSLFNGDYIVKLKTGQELKLSRNYRDRIAHLF
ncbi:MAG TPA: response regulator [Flavisolibacter sp.]|nr:response regulator [Flavisolibacter sp.]